MPTPRTHRVTPVARPDGVDLHLGDYPENFLRDFINLLADNEALAEDFDRLLNTDPPKHDPHLRDVASRDDRFIADALAAMGETAGAVHVDGGPVLDKLAGALDRISRRQGGRPIGAVPQQRNGEAA